ncbi:aldo/keto reductase [Actinoplanes solisilvae]|uniref:aldo/keto reductase n=1 Tax=Actinoplanes solisilvae TaxID=2486853 RepID=UPI001F0BF962|nr:aldo/keto reductase [Actinoplanes solisilvae]
MTIGTRKLGVNGPEVSTLGLGAMGMSDLYGPADEQESVATLHAALDAGVTLVDTGDFYGSGHNEMLVGRVLRERDRGDVVVSVKFGSRRTPDGGFQPVPYDVSPAAVKDRLAYSLRRLGTDYIDIYRSARLNPQIPVEDTVGALEEMRQGPATIFARTAPGSRARTSTRTCVWSRRCGRRPSGSAPPPGRSRSRGCCGRAATSCR